jgi:hypothetical protein
MPRISNRGLGRRRTEMCPKHNDGASSERGQNNATPERRNQPISIPQTTLTAIEGLGGTGSLIVALLEESFRLKLAKDEAKKLSRRLKKSKKKTT